MERPLGVALLGAFLITLAFAVVLLVLGWTYAWNTYASLAPPGSAIDRSFESLGIGFAVLLIGVATISALTGVGVYDGRDWAWPLAFGLAATEGGLGVAMAVVGPGVARGTGLALFAVSLAILLYLTRKPVRTWFGKT